MSAKELRKAFKLGISLECVSDRLWEFQGMPNTGAYYGTKWRGEIDLEQQCCFITDSPTHPHVVDGKLCVHDLPDGDLMTWVQALAAIWQHQDLDDAWRLRECVEDMIEGFWRDPDVEQDLLSEYNFIKRGLVDLNDNRADHYRILIRKLIEDSSETESY